MSRSRRWRRQTNARPSRIGQSGPDLDECCLASPPKVGGSRPLTAKMRRMLNRRVIAVALAVAGVAFTAAPAVAAPVTVTLPGTAAGWQPTGLTVSPAHPVQLERDREHRLRLQQLQRLRGRPGRRRSQRRGLPGRRRELPGARPADVQPRRQDRRRRAVPARQGPDRPDAGDGPLSIAYNDSSWGDNIGSYTVTLNTLATDTPGAVGGSVPATLSLTLGQPASFGNFAPGTARDYLASTTATVISTAGDATLSVADPSSVQTGHLVNGTFFLPQALQARAEHRLVRRRRLLGDPDEPADASTSRSPTRSSRSSSSSRSAPTTRCAPAPTPSR